MGEIKCPKKLNISLFYRLNGWLPHKDLDDEHEMILIHLYETFYNESMKLWGKRSDAELMYYIIY